MNNNKTLRKLKALMLFVILLSPGVIKSYAHEGKPLSSGLGKYELSMDMKY
ncbi:MAG: hypothetical protein GXO81_04700, partial [Chlorobi bacterium]|nr:hypothetical protein [Chlorobiota bacterium]